MRFQCGLEQRKYFLGEDKILRRFFIFYFNIGDLYYIEIEVYEYMIIKIYCKLILMRWLVDKFFKMFMINMFKKLEKKMQEVGKWKILLENLNLKN